ncbi:glycosyltransferase family 4 protein [Gleimia hominis]|uniref:glycosyltransferase family 4 protein n=1 Tax=Gleimia hominis TaxID=595468 RepID=UPI000C806CBE|nr:glycosyltransferase family 4 protein [Gleimia hominis]WIK65122.1 glycosyltransferase family 4 protein [Gleimia hominis]
MRIGIVCPYSWDVPGGVQFHVRDLAQELMRRGHEVSVIAPAENDVPEFVTSAGGGFAVKYNGSVAKLSMSPIAYRRTVKWLQAGDFDVLHVHEPLAPSINLIAIAQATCPVVATCHSAMEKSRAMAWATPLFAPLLERIDGRIAVSAEARRTVVQHQGGDAVIIPNGVYTQAFRQAQPEPAWQQSAQRPVVSFLGRLDEPRKGLPVLVGAFNQVLARHPGARFLIAGKGYAEQARAAAAELGDSVEFLGPITDAQKASLFSGSTVYVAPQTGGESFGIVLVEAMASGTGVIASDIEAFRLVLEDGKLGTLFSTGDSQALANAINAALDDRAHTQRLAQLGERACAKYDWDTVTDQVLTVYDTVIGSRDHGVPSPTLVNQVRNLFDRRSSI